MMLVKIRNSWFGIKWRGILFLNGLKLKSPRAFWFDVLANKYAELILLFLIGALSLFAFCNVLGEAAKLRLLISIMKQELAFAGSCWQTFNKSNEW